MGSSLTVTESEALGACRPLGQYKVDRIRTIRVMKKILIIIVALGIVALIVGIVMQNHRLEAYQRDPSLQPPADVMNIGLVQPSVACARIQDHLKDKKLSDLKAWESEALQNCKAMGY